MNHGISAMTLIAKKYAAAIAATLTLSGIIS